MSIWVMYIGKSKYQDQTNNITQRYSMHIKEIKQSKKKGSVPQ